MHLGYNPHHSILFVVNQEVVKSILDHDPTIFLGKAIGFQIINDHFQIKEFHDKADIIL